MYSFLLQDWITLSGGSNGLTPGAATWFEVSTYEDIALTLEVKYLSFVDSVIVNYETAPLPEERAFISALAVTAFVGVRVDTLRATCGLVPPARYLRWRLVGGAAWTMTFRIIGSGYSLG